MYYSEMTNGAKIEFINFILENEKGYMAVTMIERFINNERSTEEIETELNK